jgi:thiaminase
MKQLLLLLSICALPYSAYAEKGQSIMFGDPDPLYQERTPDTTAEEHSEHCKQLRRQMDELKGKPQRRHAVAERYKLECQPPLH